jgi:phosphoribosylformylglycinamidine cyclo-ligase
MQKIGNIDDPEMHRVFNMGVGLVIVAPPGQQMKLAEAMAPFLVWELGRVEAGVHEVRFAGGRAS